MSLILALAAWEINVLDRLLSETCSMLLQYHSLVATTQARAILSAPDDTQTLNSANLERKGYKPNSWIVIYLWMPSTILRLFVPQQHFLVQDYPSSCRAAQLCKLCALLLTSRKNFFPLSLHQILSYSLLINKSLHLTTAIQSLLSWTLNWSWATSSSSRN